MLLTNWVARVNLLVGTTHLLVARVAVSQVASPDLLVGVVTLQVASADIVLVAKADILFSKGCESSKLVAMTGKKIQLSLRSSATYRTQCLH